MAVNIVYPMVTHTSAESSERTTSDKETEIILQNDSCVQLKLDVSLLAYNEPQFIDRVTITT